MTTVRIGVQNRFAWGSSRVNGSTPKIEHQITTLRPNVITSYSIHYTKLYDTEEVRVKRGLAYSVGAESAPLLHAPLVIGGVGTQTAKIGESLAIIRAEWAKMRDHGSYNFV